MASFSGHLHRPLSAMAVAAFAAVSSHELPDKLSHHRLSDASTSADTLVLLPSARADVQAAPSASALSGAQLLPRDIHSLRLLKAPFASLPVMQTVYQYANFAKTSGRADAMPAIPSSPSDVLYCWHPPSPRVCAEFPDRSQTVVVLLGWLGSRQKHLKRYAIFTPPGASMSSPSPSRCLTLSVITLEGRLRRMLRCYPNILLTGSGRRVGRRLFSTPSAILVGFGTIHVLLDFIHQ